MSAVRTIVGLEVRQRMRSRGWYVLLAVFFVVVGVVTLGAVGLTNSVTASDGSQATGVARVMFDLILMFVLLLALLVSPALSANAISGDRANGTLAILQVTPVRTWQLMAGKWLAGWLSSAAFLVAALPWLVFAGVLGDVHPGSMAVGVLMVLVQFAVVTGIGVAVSAISGRTLFAVVVTYLVVAALSLGSLISFGLGAQFVESTVRANQVEYASYYDEETGEGWNGMDEPERCTGPLRTQTVPDLRRTGWVLAPNPFVVLADAVPFDKVNASTVTGTTPLSFISEGVRYTQLPPSETVNCVDGEFDAELARGAWPSSEGSLPVWPMGLGLQVLLLTGLLVWGHRRLHTPAGRLTAGTRVA